VARGPRAVMPKNSLQLEESKDEEEPAQDSSVNCEEDDDTGNAESTNKLEEDDVSEDQSRVGAAGSRRSY